MRCGEVMQSMRWSPRWIAAVCALACAVDTACGGGGSGSTVIFFPPPFPQGFLPLVLGTGTSSTGDVAFDANGDLYGVRGTPDVVRILKSDGSVGTFASGVGGGGTALRSILAGPDGRIFVGSAGGRIFAIDSMGVSSLLIDTGTGAAITGMAIAPVGFGDFANAIVAAAGTAGVLVVTTSAMPSVTVLAAPGERYVDVAFTGTTLLALDATDDEIDTVSASGDVVSFQGGFQDPVGMAVDTVDEEIWVADASDDALLALPVAGGAPALRAPYELSSTAPSGIAFDGLGASAWLSAGPVLRGARVPRVDPSNPNFGLIATGPTVGYGDLEFDRLGAFLLSASAPGSSPTNFLFSVSRDIGSLTTLASPVGDGEDLLGLAYDPFSETIYVGSVDGNLYRRDSDGTVELLVADVTGSGDALLGLEIAPLGFGGFGGQLVATTDGGEVWAIDPANPTSPVCIVTITSSDHGLCGTMLPGSPAILPDLVFASDGTLYVLDNGNDDPSPARVLTVTAAGAVNDLGVSGQLGRPDGIEIDEGGDRLFLATAKAGGDQVVAVGPLSGAPVVTPLANVSIDDGFFPTGIVYDRLGRVVLRTGNTFTSLGGVSVFP